MSDKQQKKGKQKKNKRASNSKAIGSLQPLPKEVAERFFAWSQLVRKEYGELRTVVEGGLTKRRRDRDVPYGFPEFMKGTENPVFRLKLQNTLISLTATTAYTTVYNVTAGILQNFGDLANMFDEYRFLRGCFLIFVEQTYNYTQAANASHGSFGGGYCIDYGTSTAIASLDAGRAHDTWKNCYFVLGPGLSIKQGGTHKWPVHFEKLTDESWIPTTTSNTVVAYFKPYIPSTSIPISVTGAFSIYGWFDVQVRGQIG